MKTMYTKDLFRSAETAELWKLLSILRHYEMDNSELANDLQKVMMNRLTGGTE